jgi:hypothetical protein
MRLVGHTGVGDKYIDRLVKVILRGLEAFLDLLRVGHVAFDGIEVLCRFAGGILDFTHIMASQLAAGIWRLLAYSLLYFFVFIILKMQ